jgi:DNA-binding NarL/FixJ family response regulator
MVTVLIVDDDPFNIEGIAMYLKQKGFTAVTATNASDAWFQAREHQLDVAIVDIVIPDSKDHYRNLQESVGIRLAMRLRTLYPQLPIILFSAYEDRGLEIAELIKTATRGFAYKLKGCTAAELYESIQQVQAGKVILDSEVTNISGLAEIALAAIKVEERKWVEEAIQQIPALTPREKQIAESVAAGHVRHHIARAVNIDSKTVENHISNIYRKLGLLDMSHRAAHLRQSTILAKAFLISDLSKRK